MSSLVRKQGAVQTGGMSSTGFKRATNLPSTSTKSPVLTPTPTPNPSPNARPRPEAIKAQKAKEAEEYYRSLQKKSKLFNKSTVTTLTDKSDLANKNTPPTATGTLTPGGYKFNLPPHAWSIPLQPSKVDSVNPLVLSPAVDTSNFHGLRRGRLWFFNTNNIQTGWDKETNTAVSSPTAGDWGPDAAKRKYEYDQKYKSTKLNEDRKWGFQFLWNPDGFNVSVETNLEVTPSSADRLRTVAGAFPGMEYINMQLVIDRTNDFACIRNALITGTDSFSSLVKYYSKNTFPQEDNLTYTFEQRIKNLAELGTLADLEYFFKMVNGDGVGGKPWVNLLQRETADIGFLQPSLIALQLGPGKENLSYVGWINNLQITHLAFTQTMIPIRTQISFGIRCFAGSAITS